MIKNITPYIPVAGYVVLALVSITVGPLLGIWALNSLFGMNLEYSFWNGVSVGLLFR